MPLWQALAAAGGAAVLLFAVLLLVVLLCRRRHLRARKRTTRGISVVLPSMSKKRSHRHGASVSFPFDGLREYEENSGDDGQHDVPEAADSWLPTVTNKPSGMPLGANVPVVPRGKKVSLAWNVFNQSTEEMDGALVRHMHANMPLATPQTSLANSEADTDGDGAGRGRWPLRRKPALSAGVSGSDDRLRLTDLRLTTDDSEHPSGAETTRKVRPEWLRPSAMRTRPSASLCLGFIRYSVCLSDPAIAKTKKKLPIGADVELRVAVVAALALDAVGRDDPVLIQVELIPPTNTPHSPVRFGKKKADVRHSKAVVRGGQVVSGSFDTDQSRRPHSVSQHEYGNLVLSRWKNDAQRQQPEDSDISDNDLPDLLPLQKRWPFHQELQPFQLRVSEDGLAGYHLRLTVWCKELTSPPQNGNHEDLTMDCVTNGHTRHSVLSAPTPLPASGGSLLQSVKQRIRTGSVNGRGKWSVHQVGEIVVPLADFKPLTTSQTRTDELAFPLSLARDERKKEQLMKASPSVGRLVSFPGRMSVTLTYWQTPVHRMEIAVTTGVMLPSFLDRSKNKSRDTLLKIRLHVNGQRVRERSSDVVAKSRGPNYALNEVLDLSRASLDRDDVQVILAVKPHRRHPLRVRSTSFAVHALCFGASSPDATCREHWLQALVQPAVATTQDHVLHMRIASQGRQ